MSPEVCFTARDMALFAAASGDHSPLHTDPVFARRTGFGQCIVYGGLETLAMLGALAGDARAQIRWVSSSFPAPVLIGERLTTILRAHPSRPEWEVRLNGRGRTLARLVAGASSRPAPDAAGDQDEIVGPYRIGPEGAALLERFGLEDLDPAVFAGVLWASNVVGTTIPDFDGLCAAVTLAAQTEAPARRGADLQPEHQRVVVREYDERTDRMLIEGSLSAAGGQVLLSGRIECLPFGPTASSAVALTGEPPPLAGTAVVIGASRGLGAALTLALLERGYAVHGCYERSSAAASELADLAGAYAGRLSLHQLDGRDPQALAELAGELRGELDGIAVCAAPAPLPAGLGDGLAPYVADSLALAAVPLGALLARLGRGRSWVLLCSAPAAAEPSRELPQLAAAKAALEAIGRWVALSSPGLRVLAARLPRMRTDLASTPGSRAAAIAPEAVAAELVRRLLDEDAPAGFELAEVSMAPAGI